MKSTPSKWVNPTTVLFGCLFFPFVSVLLGSFFASDSLSVAQWIGVFSFQALIVFLAFTPLHESSHGIASKSRLINQVVLVLSAFTFFLADGATFRTIHIAHHAKTNQAGEDPDHFTSAPTLLGRWVRSFFLLFSYYHFMWKKRPVLDSRAQVRMVVSALTPWTVLAIGLLIGKPAWVLSAWVLPVLFSTGLLSFVNTAWPHDTHGETHRMKNSRMHLVPAWFQALMGNQNMHLVHHLQPTLPWYKYPEVWGANREKWLAQGASVVDYR